MEVTKPYKFIGFGARLLPVETAWSLSGPGEPDAGPARLASEAAL